MTDFVKGRETLPEETLKSRVMERPVREGEYRIAHYDADFAPCDCVTHEFHCDCTIVARGRGKGEVRDRCMCCGRTWRSE